MFVGHRPPRQQRRLLERDAEVVVAAGRRRLLAVHERLPARRLLEVGEDPQDRRLPAARRSEQRDERARRASEVDASRARRPRSAGPGRPCRAGAARCRRRRPRSGSSVVASAPVKVSRSSVIGSRGDWVFSSGFSAYTSSSTDMSKSLSLVIVMPASASVLMFSSISSSVIVNSPLVLGVGGEDQLVLAPSTRASAPPR